MEQHLPRLSCGLPLSVPHSFLDRNLEGCLGHFPFSWGSPGKRSSHPGSLDVNLINLGAAQQLNV